MTEQEKERKVVRAARERGDTTTLLKIANYLRDSKGLSRDQILERVWGAL